MTSHDASDAGKMPDEYDGNGIPPGPYTIKSDEPALSTWSIFTRGGKYEIGSADNEALARLFASAPELKAEVERLRTEIVRLQRICCGAYMALPIIKHHERMAFVDCNVEPHVVALVDEYEILVRQVAALARKDGPA